MDINNNTLFCSAVAQLAFPEKAPAEEEATSKLSTLPTEVQERIFTYIAINGDLQARLVCREWNASILTTWNRHNHLEIKDLIENLALRIDWKRYPLTMKWLGGFYSVLNFRFDPELNSTPEEIERTYRTLQGELMYSLNNLPNEERKDLREFLNGKLPNFINENGEINAFTNLINSINKGDFKIFFSMLAGCLFLLTEEERGLAAGRASAKNRFLILNELLENGPISEMHRDAAVMSTSDMRFIQLLLEKGSVSYNALAYVYNLAAAEGNKKVLCELPGQELFWFPTRVTAIVESTVNGHGNLIPIIAKQYISTLSWKHLLVVTLFWLRNEL